MVNMTHMGHDRSNLFFSDRIQLKLLKKMILIGGICLLTACAKKIELQTQIPENDANEILSPESQNASLPCGYLFRGLLCNQIHC